MSPLNLEKLRGFWFYATNLDNLDEWTNSLKHSLPKYNQEEIENLNNLISIK